MGSFVFTWEHPADEVYVTGTFDDWSKSERLIKTNNIFTKEVFLSNVPEKIYYKFVVDGNWVTDHTAPQENDESGNLNNVLTADRIIISTPETTGIMSGVTADSSTTALAGEVPLEKDKKNSSATVPGAFPDTSAIFEKGESESSTNPSSSNKTSTSPATGSEEHSKLGTDNSKDSEIGPDSKIENEQTFSVSPLPAFPGAVNPISIAPGQKLPDYSTLTTNTLTSFVDLGGEILEQDGVFTSSNPVTDSNHALKNEYDANVENLHCVSDTLKNDAPVSILPIRTKETDNLSNSPFIQSVGPQSTTATLLAGVPINNDSRKLHDDPPVASKIIPDTKEVEGVNKLDGITQNKVTENTSPDQVAGVNNSSTILESSNIESKPPNSHSELSPSSQDQVVPSENSASHAASSAPKVVKEEIINSGQNPAVSNDDTAVPTKQVEKDDSTGLKIENVTGDSDSTTSPKTTVDPGQATAFTPQGVAAGETTNDDPETRASGSHAQDETVDSPTATNNPAAENNSASDDKADKKKKRASFFGRLKAKFIYRE